MKKTFIAVALVAVMGLGLASCNKDEQKCWKVTYTMPTLGGTTEVVTYQWCSQNALEAQVANWKVLGYEDIKYSATIGVDTMEDCLAKNTED